MVNVRYKGGKRSVPANPVAAASGPTPTPPPFGPATPAPAVPANLLGEAVSEKVDLTFVRACRMAHGMTVLNLRPPHWPCSPRRRLNSALLLHAFA